MALRHRFDLERLRVRFCDARGEVSTAAQRAQRRMEDARTAVLTGGLRPR